MRIAVDGPTATPLPYGLLSAAIVVDTDDPHAMAGTQWMSFICGEAGITDWCVPSSDDSPGDESPESPGNEEKAFNRPEADGAPPVIIYYGAECTAITGYDYDQARLHATQGLTLGEQRTLEQWVMYEVLSKRAVNLSPSGNPLPIPAAVGHVESGLADRFSGMGIIHVPVGAASMLGQAGQLIADGGGCAAAGE
ncbi:MAG TPA: cupin, partial [Gammaproteobacteria bacterium]|nr:cupin [Gammaproteobacteria bacterium]